MLIFITCWLWSVWMNDMSGVFFFICLTKKAGGSLRRMEMGQNLLKSFTVDWTSQMYTICSHWSNVCRNMCASVCLFAPSWLEWEVWVSLINPDSVFHFLRCYCTYSLHEWADSIGCVLLTFCHFQKKWERSALIGFVLSTCERLLLISPKFQTPHPHIFNKGYMDGDGAERFSNLHHVLWREQTQVPFRSITHLR